MSCLLLAGAVDRKVNIIVSTPIDHEFLGDTLDELRDVSKAVIVLNEYSLLSDLTATVSGAEVIVFSSMADTDYELKEAAAELMRSRSLGGLKLPNLKSVVGFFGRTTDETDVLAESYATLGPSLALDWRW